ncbi:10083_t:CDS:2, partial [Cetraspora pellucida]
MSLAGALNVRKRNNENELVYDHDIQEFENLPFKIKVETINEEDNYARLFFFKDDPYEKIDIPEGIICLDKTAKVLKNEHEQREKKQTKGVDITVDNTIKDITDLNLNNSECDDKDSNDEMDIKKE